jgi:uncharacterized protein (DUF433 family)
MTLTVAAEPAPIRVERDGTARIGGTRVTLDTIVAVYDGGATPSEIAERFPSLGLADVYAVLSYVLRHRSEVDAYLREREQRAQRARAHSESRRPQAGVRERLLARGRREHRTDA